MFTALKLALAVGVLQVTPPPPMIVAPDEIPQPLPEGALPKDEGFPPGELWAKVCLSPPLCDVLRFPPRDATTRARGRSWPFRQAMEDEKKLWPATQHWKFDMAITQAERAYAAWDKLDDAQQPYRTGWSRRLALADLKAMLGDEAYAEGRMPPPIPTHLFRELK